MTEPPRIDYDRLERDIQAAKAQGKARRARLNSRSPLTQGLRKRQKDPVTNGVLLVINFLVFCAGAGFGAWLW